MPKAYDHISVTNDDQILHISIQLNSPPTPENKRFISEIKRMVHSHSEDAPKEHCELVEVTFTCPGANSMRVAIDIDQPIDSQVQVYLRRLGMRCVAFSYDVECFGQKAYSGDSTQEAQQYTLRAVRQRGPEDYWQY